MKRITGQERKHQNYMRVRALKVGQIYEKRLITLRRKEVKRVLKLCSTFPANPDTWGSVIEGNFNEGYLTKWYTGLYTNAGLPFAKTTARDLGKEKAAQDDNDTLWLQQLNDYAATRAGENIQILKGTAKDSLVSILRQSMKDHPDASVEDLTDMVYKQYGSQVLKWQARRIAQTETMISTAYAAAGAAKTLDVKFVKQWCVSGLSNSRDSHLAEDGKTLAAEDPFELPGGLLMYPHDNSLGASAGEIVNCACACIRRPA